MFLDANLVIYHIEQPTTWGPKASARISAFVAAGEMLTVSDLVRMECLVGPLKMGDIHLLNDFRTFFSSPDVRFLAITAAVADRAAQIRVVGQQSIAFKIAGVAWKIDLPGHTSEDR